MAPMQNCFPSINFENQEITEVFIDDFAFEDPLIQSDSTDECIDPEPEEVRKP